jgi:hypothetical protein
MRYVVVYERVGGISQSMLLSNAGCECKCNSRRRHHQRHGEEDCSSSNNVMIPHG